MTTKPAPLFVALILLAGCTVQAQSEPMMVEPMEGSAGGTVVVEAPAAAPAPAGQPVTCAENEDVNLANVNIDAGQGSAIIASGNCTLTIDGCNLTGGNVVSISDNATVNLTDCTISGIVAIDARGSADVNLTGGSISGTQAAVTAIENADVNLNGTAEAGPMQAGENADISRN